MKRISTLFILLIVLVFQANAQENSLLWKVSSPDGSKTSYLFGTYHLVGSDYLEEHPKVQKAYDEAKSIVVEVVIDSSAMMVVGMKSLMLGKSLKAMVTEEEYKLLVDELEPAIGTSLGQLDQFKPAAISALYAIHLAQKATPKELSFSGQPIDAFFAMNGKIENKKILTLETALEQADILYGSSTVEEQAKDLVEMVQEKEKVKEMTKLIIESYHKEDLKTMWTESMSMEDTYGDMDELVDNRNKNWIPKLKPLFDGEGNVFVAVGALHLPGENGLIELLKKEGYQVTPVF